jgi:hypothetical protein
VEQSAEHPSLLSYFRETLLHTPIQAVLPAFGLSRFRDVF